MKREESRQAPSVIFEGMTSIRSVINGFENGVTDRRIVRVFADSSKREQKKKELSYLTAISHRDSFDIEYVSSDEIDRLTTGSSHGGIVAECTERTVPTLGKTDIKGSFWVMIEGIEDPYNFGYALRTVFAAGADGIVLSPRNWMSAAGVVCRSSAGASEMLPCFVSDAEEAVTLFSECGFKTVAAGIRNSVCVYDADLSYPLFLVVGGEKRGISRAVLDKCDETVRLDYGREFAGSLSAASAASVIAYEVFRQNRGK